MSSPKEHKEARTLLLNMRELLSRSGVWCQGSHAKDSAGKIVLPGNSSAVQFCVVGALRRLSRYEEANALPVLELLYTAVRHRYSCPPGFALVPSHQAMAEFLAEWNDGMVRGLIDVLNVIDDALELTHA